MADKQLEVADKLPFDTKYINSFFRIEDKRYYRIFNNIWGPLRNTLGEMSIKNNSHQQNCSEYDQIYALGDLHADYASFYKRLENFGLITPPMKIGEETPLDIKFENLTLEDLEKLTAEFEWIPRRTLLVICGDIVDGGRGKDYQVQDNYGSSELLLHVFLKNLKFKARQYESDVICIYGNHDMMLFYHNIEDYQQYVHKTAKFFFGNYKNRAKWLTPFYKHNFYFVFELMDDKGKAEIRFAHGALHTSESNRSLYDETIKLQTETLKNFESFYSDETKNSAEKKNSLSDNSELTKQWLPYLDDPKYKDKYNDPKSVVWQRTYNLFEENDNKCNTTNNGDPPIVDGPTIVVGHCQSKHQTYPQPSEDKRLCTEDGTDKSRCIYPKCFDKNGIPKIVMVDTAMSNCFNRDYGKDMRSVEILLIRKSSEEEETSKGGGLFSRISSIVSSAEKKAPEKPTEVKEEKGPFFDIYESLYYDDGVIHKFVLNKPNRKLGGGGIRRTYKQKVRYKRGILKRRKITRRLKKR